MYSYNPYYEKYLAHYGVLGMKWGVRRYQNKDGSLTPKGKKRQKELQKKLDDAMQKNPTGKLGWTPEQKKVFKKINRSSFGTFTTHMQYDDILKKYKHTVVTKDEMNKIESKIKKQNEDYNNKIEKELKNKGFSEEKSPYSSYTFYNKKLPKNCTLSVGVYGTGPFSTLHPPRKSVDDMISNVVKMSNYIEKNFSLINKEAANYAINHVDTYDVTHQDPPNRFKNFSKKQLANYLEKQGPNSISIDSEGSGGTMWYQDGKKNDMDFFGDHSLVVEFGVDKNGKVKPINLSVEG